MFDVLTYQKGGSVLRMLEQFIGPDVFREGIHDYLVTHSYGNTETRDLWDALERSSGRPVSRIMDTWINQGGYPLVTVGVGRDAGPAAVLLLGCTGRGHRVPLAGAGPPPGARLGLRVERRPAATAASQPSGGSGDIVINAGGSGYYRVAYSPERVAHLAGRLADLAPLERYNLVSDTWAATLAGHARVADLLRLAKALADSGEGDPSVWSVVVGAIGLFDRIVPAEGRPTLATGVRTLLGPAGRPPGLGPVARGRRPHTVAPVGRPAHARHHRGRPRRAERGVQAVRRPGRPHPCTATRPPLCSTSSPPTGASPSTRPAWPRYRSATTPQEENRFLDALAGFGAAELAARTFDLAMTEVRSQDAPFLIRLLLANRETGPATWGRIVGAWDEFPEKFPSNTLPRMLDGVRALCSPPELAAEVTGFVNSHPLAAGGRTVEQILERLAMSVAFGQREAADLADTLTEVLGLEG